MSLKVKRLTFNYKSPIQHYLLVHLTTYYWCDGQGCWNETRHGFKRNILRWKRLNISNDTTQIKPKSRSIRKMTCGWSGDKYGLVLKGKCSQCQQGHLFFKNGNEWHALSCESLWNSHEISCQDDHSNGELKFANCDSTP